MTYFNIVSTDLRENETLTESYTLFKDANQIFQNDINLWKSVAKRGQCTIIELTPTQFALYNESGELFYTSQIIAEPDNKFE